MPNLGADLAINVTTNTATLETGMAKASEIIRNQTQKIAGELGKVNSAISKVGSLFAGLGVGLSVAAFASGIKSAIDYADTLNDLSKKTGIAVETLGGLGYAAKQSGTDLETIAKGTKNLAVLMSDAAGGSKQAQSALSAVGISAAELSKGLIPADEALLRIADKFKGYADGPEQAALATELFKKAGVNLIPFLEEGGDKLRGLIEEYRTYGGVTTETAQRADAFNDTVAKIQLIAGSLFRELAAGLLPTLQTLADIFVDSKTKGEGFKGIVEGISVSIKGLVIAGIAVVETFRAVGASIGTVIGAIVGIARGDSLTTVWAGLKAGFADVGTSISGSVDRIKQVWNAGMESVATAATTQLPKARAPLVATGKAVADLGESLKKLTAPLNDLVVSLQREGVALDAQLRSLQTYGQETKETQAATVEFDLTLGKLAATYQTLLAINPALALGFAEVARAQAKQNDATKVAIDVEKEYVATRKAYIESLAQGLTAIDDEIKAERDRGAALGKTRTEVLDLAIAYIEANDVSRTVLEIGAEEIKQQDEKLKKLRELRGVVASNEALEGARRAYDDTFQYIDNLGREAFAALTGSGENAAKKIAETLKTQILAALYRIAIQPFVVRIAAAISGTDPAAAVGGITNLAGSGGFGGLNNLPGLIGLPSFSTAVGNLGTIIPTFSASLESGAGLFASAGAAFAGTAASFATLALPLIGLLPLLSGLFKSGGGPKGGGSASSAVSAEGLVTPGDLGRFFTPADADATVKTVVDTIGATYSSIARSFGATITTASFGLGFDTDPKGTAPDRLSSETIVGGVSVRSVRDLDLGRGGDVSGALNTEAQRQMLAALQNSGLPAYLDKLFDSVNAATATPEQIQTLIATGQSMKLAVDSVTALGGSFETLDPEKILGLVDAFGGLDQFLQGFNYVEQNFTTASEKMTKATDKLNADFAALGLEVPQTHQAFLDLLNGLDLTTEAGQKMYAALVLIAPGFIAVKGTADQASAAVTNFADTATDAAAQINAAAASINITDVGSIIEQANAYVQARVEKVDGLLSSFVGTAGDKLTERIKLLGSYYTQALASSFASPLQREVVLKGFKTLMSATAADLSNYTKFLDQYGSDSIAAQLVDLSHWFAEQQNLLAGNSTALASLQSIMDKRWAAIVAGVETGVDGTLDQLARLKQGIAEYLQGLVVSEISPLTPKQKLDTARANLDAGIELARAGDLTALGTITRDLDTFLKLDRDFFKSSDTFASDFLKYTTILGDIAGVMPNGQPPVAFDAAIAAALPTSSKLASSADIATNTEATQSLEDTVRELITALANSNTADAKMLADAALKAAQQTAADTVASSPK